MEYESLMSIIKGKRCELTQLHLQRVESVNRLKALDQLIREKEDEIQNLATLPSKVVAVVIN
jgi:uncharacterized protein YydD (DUF2326 family)